VKELTIPEAARQDAASVEVLRVWIANHRQHVSLQMGAWEDPGAWGILLADLARHVVNAYEQEQAVDSTDVLARIRALFDAELDSPTDLPTGTIITN
jgi:hypothetical protein